MLAAVVLEGDNIAESFFGTEFQRFASTRVLVDEYRASMRDNRGVIVVEGSAEVLSSQYLGI